VKVLVQVACGVALIGLGGCATVVKGTTQEIAVNTTPAGGSCDVSQKGKVVAQTGKHSKVKVDRSGNSLSVSCKKEPEHPQPRTVEISSKFNGATVGNVLLGGLVGIVVDASTGANYSYPEEVMVDLTSADSSLPLTSSAPPVTDAQTAAAASSSTPTATPAATAPSSAPTMTPVATPAAKPEAKPAPLGD